MTETSCVRILRQQTISCVSSTSMKGCPRILRSRHQAVKILWVVSTTILLMLAMYLTFNLVASFLKYSTVVYMDKTPWTKFRRESPEGAVYPQITVCNIRRIGSPARLRTVKTFGEYADMLHSMGLDSVMLNQYLNPDEYYRSTPFRNLTDVGQTQENFLLHCTVSFWRGVGSFKGACDKFATIEKFSTPETFNCLTIGVDHKRIPEGTHPKDISLIANLADESPSIMPADVEAESSTGARIMLHYKSRYPNIRKDIKIPPGYESIVRPEPKLRKRLPAPHGQCQNTTHRKFVDHLDREYSYSSTTCTTSCLNNIILKECQCYESSLPLTQAPRSFEIENFTSCGAIQQGIVKAKRDQLCVSRITRQEVSICLTTCPTPCVDRGMETTVDHVLWPDALSQLAIYASVIRGKSIDAEYSSYSDLLDAFNNGSIEKEEVKLQLSRLRIMRENLGKITLEFSEREVSTVEDHVAMTLPELLSQLGGVLNLWSGITVFIFVEVFELFMNTIIEVFLAERNKHQIEMT